MPIAEALAQRVELVGERDNLAFARRRESNPPCSAACSARRSLARPPRARLGALRVQPADDALQIGELFHHFGGQVGLAQQRRALGVCVAAELFHQRDHALGLFRYDPSLAWKVTFARSSTRSASFFA